VLDRNQGGKEKKVDGNKGSEKREEKKGRREGKGER